MEINRVTPLLRPAFSLVEMAVAALIMGVVLLVFGTLLTATAKSARRSEILVENQTQLRVAMQRFSKELTLAGVGIPANRVFVTANDSQLAFRFLDVLNNHCQATPPDTVVFRYLTTNGDMVRYKTCANGTGDTVFLYQGYRNSRVRFVYRQRNGNITSSLPDITNIDYAVSTSSSQTPGEFTYNKSLSGGVYLFNVNP